MSIPEEIEQLKIKLDQTADENEQAEVLMEILKKYNSINSADSQPYIDRLLIIGEKLGQPLYKAWGLYHFSFNERIKGEYDSSIDLANKAIAISIKIKDEKCIASSYTNIGTANYMKGNYLEALKIFSSSLNIYEEIGDRPGIAESYHNIGMVYREQDNYANALKSYFSSLEISKTIGNKSTISNTLNNIGYVYYGQGNYPEALKNYFSALKIKQEIDDKNSIAAIYGNIGLVYNQMDNYIEALENLFYSLKIRREIGDKTGIAASLNCIALVYEKQGEYTEALKNNFSSLKIKEELGNKAGIAICYNNIANVYEKQGNYAEALKNSFASLKITEEIGKKSSSIISYINIGHVYYIQSNYPEALKYLTAALNLSEEVGHKDLTKEASHALANTFKAKGEFETALQYYEKYHAIEKEMLGAETQKQLNNLGFMHNLEQKEKDLEIEHLRNVELKAEKDRSEALLLNILPAEVAEELKEKGTANAKHFDEVTVLFTDFKGFTTVSERLTPQQLVDELHACFSAFDEITHRYGIEKIKTVGDAYLAVAGLPLANEDHAQAMVKAAKEIRDFMLARKKQLGEMTFEIRIGVHSGSVVAGIVGVKKFAYDIWGDTVNTAARMEQNSEAGKINISESTYQLVKDHFSCEYRGEIEAKNKGRLKMYFVN